MQSVNIIFKYALNKGNDPAYLTDDPDFNCQVGLSKVNVSYIVLLFLCLV